MKPSAPSALEIALAWSRDVLGPLEVDQDHSREHPGHQSGTLRLRAAGGNCYLKVHQNPEFWENEVYAYEHWAQAFGDHAPRLLAVRAGEPLALVVSELPGIPMEEANLTPLQELAIWRSAGEVLSALHDLPPGGCFGPPSRSGGCSGAQIRAAQIHDARDYLTAELEHWLQDGLRSDCLSSAEQAIIRAARALIPAFAGEPARPCHRDYGPANWLVSPAGQWLGVIDFEFARWDVRAAEFTRYPTWEWLLRPELTRALLAGYGRAFSPQEEQQMLFCHVLYALAAVVWGMQSAYYGFAAEGREALQALSRMI